MVHSTFGERYWLTYYSRLLFTSLSLSHTHTLTHNLPDIYRICVSLYTHATNKRTHTQRCAQVSGFSSRWARQEAGAVHTTRPTGVRRLPGASGGARPGCSPRLDCLRQQLLAATASDGSRPDAPLRVLPLSGVCGHTERK